MPMYKLYEDERLLFRHWREEKPKRADFHMHIHDQYEILYFVRGKAHCIVETEAYTLLPDTLVIMRPNESHMIDIQASETYERYTLNFSAALLDAVDPAHILLSPFAERALGEKNIYTAEEFDLPPKKLFAAMAEAIGGSERLPILAHFYALLSSIYTAFRNKGGDTAAEHPHSPAEDVAAYINLHLFDDISVEGVAEHFYISVSQLNRRFKKATGFTAWEYILKKRLVAARDLIRTGCPVKHAYLKCGFNDYSSFYRMYVKKFGVSPKNDAGKPKKD